MHRRIVSIALGLALACGAPGAVAQDEDVQQVPVNGVKNPEMKSYRAVLKGLDMFDDQHHLSPNVPELRFKILSGRGRGTRVNMRIQTEADRTPADDPYLLRIAGDDQSIQVPISADGMFTVPRSEAAYDANADLVLNRKKGNYQISAFIRTPGLPDNVRRLGDMRLECKVQVAIAKEEIPFWIVAMANTILLSTDWCMTTKGDVHFTYKTDKPLLSATLVHGERSQKIKSGTRSFQVQLGDRNWPDDTLVQLEYAPEEPANTGSGG